MRYAIYACDNYYQGEHGMSYVEVNDYLNEDHAINNAISYSLEEVIRSFPAIYEEIEAELKDIIDSDMTEDDIEAKRYSLELDDVNYSIYKINEDKAISYTTEQLNEMFYDNPSGFIEEYCIPI